MSVHGFGPAPACILICGEAPGSDEVRAGKPFVGLSGMELDRMLHEVGIIRSECFVTNVVREQPPANDMALWIPAKKKDIRPDFIWFRDKRVHPLVVEGVKLLLRELELVQPTLVIALGNTPTWALTGKWGVGKWRGSQLELDTEEIKRWL